MTNVSFITTNGANELAAAIASDGQITINGAIIGSAVLTDQTQATLQAYTTASLSSAGSLVYTASAANITYNLLNSNQIQFNVLLGASIGNFAIGNFGLTLADGSLFAVVSYDTVTSNTLTKTATSGGTSGNSLILSAVCPISNAATNTNLTVITPTYAGMPEVTTDTNLPSPSAPPYATYFVHDYTEMEALNLELAPIPAIAGRFNDVWYFAPMATNYTAFLTSIIEGIVGPVPIVKTGENTVTSGTLPVTFSTPFPTGATPKIVITDAESNTWSTSNVTVYGVNSVTINGFTVVAFTWNGTAFVPSTAGVFNWVATWTP